MYLHEHKLNEPLSRPRCLAAALLRAQASDAGSDLVVSGFTGSSGFTRLDSNETGMT